MLKQEAERDQLECDWKCKTFAFEQQISSSLLEMKLWRSVVVGGGGFVNACCCSECQCGGVNVGALPSPFLPGIDAGLLGCDGGGLD